MGEVVIFFFLGLEPFQIPVLHYSGHNFLEIVQQGFYGTFILPATPSVSKQ